MITINTFNRSLIILIFICLSNIANAVLPSRDYQLWTNATLIGTLKKPFKYWLETQERFGEDASRLSQVLMRPGLGYLLREDVSLWLGYAWIKTGSPFSPIDVQETRIWQQFLMTKSIRSSKFVIRSRLEQRFIQHLSETAWRFRQLGKAEFPLQGKFYLIATDEIFIHLNKFGLNRINGFDQNRILAGFAYHADKEVTFEFGYMNQYIRRVHIPNYLGSNLYMSVLVNLD